MALEESLKSVSKQAAGDLSAKQYHFVTVNSSGQIAATGSGASASGILQDKPAALGRAGQVSVGGLSKVVCGGTVTAGTFLTSDANGAAVTAASGNYINAVAQESGVVNQIIQVAIEPGVSKV